MLVAAEAREFAGLLPLCSGVRRVDWPVHWARYGESGGRQLWMVANGAGATHAGDAANKWKQGQAEARITGERVYLLFDWDSGARKGLIDARREGRNGWSANTLI